MVADSSPPAARASGDPSSPTRQKLLDAAYELLVEQGYHTTTLQHIARRAGLTTGAIYANFVNKHELLVLAVLARWVEAGPGSWLVPDGDPPEGRELERRLVRHVCTPPTPEHRLLTEVTGAALRDPGAEALLREAVEMVASLTRRVIGEAKENGRLDEKVPTDAWVALTVNQFLGAVTSKAFDLPQPDRDDVASLFRTFTRAWQPD